MGLGDNRDEDERETGFNKWPSQFLLGYDRDIRRFSLGTKCQDLPFDLGGAEAAYHENLPEDLDEALG